MEKTTVITISDSDDDDDVKIISEVVRKAKTSIENSTSSRIKSRDHRQNENEKPFKCNTCGYSFGSISIFRRHQLMHRRERIESTECSYCEEEFSDRNSRQIHENTHKNRKKYKCFYCDRLFIGVSHRTEHHKRVHKDELMKTLEATKRKQIDRHRKKVINRREILAVNSSSNNGNKISSGDKNHPYKCGLCGQSFRERPVCKEHQMQRHGSYSSILYQSRKNAESAPTSVHFVKVEIDSTKVKTEEAEVDVDVDYPQNDEDTKIFADDLIEASSVYPVTVKTEADIKPQF